ncbi:MAG: hypothetical protein COX81_04170 [Candidatus Magasanikbacteria bacterium CG_4_10_14_0_2_um_filter_37_12]|uniref:Methyltransferase domain-containing protein n=1 Tax=Candidatus Magasanikbacteria bacterium CG_4_10_14_0_2_um_filter_37_12 TaxID=1974637 RepID=A0A2M7V6B8_9BACT|nr:MAG: hypothetical protein COX81_04170 [Candidatus Magasanikbacteria bacterium CG_4_10_14_0_2_um_filter_37_12]
MWILIAELFLVVLYALLLVFFFYTFYAFVKAAPFVPTSNHNVEKIIQIAGLNSTDTMCDLGSGDGRILFLAAKSGAKCVGIEINPILYYFSKFKKLLYRVDNVEIIRQDLWKIDLAQFDVLTLFFIAPKMEKLMKKIKAEMKPGSRVVSYAFRFPNWQPTKEDEKVRLYVV